MCAVLEEGSDRLLVIKQQVHIACHMYEVANINLNDRFNRVEERKERKGRKRKDGRKW